MTDILKSGEKKNVHVGIQSSISPGHTELFQFEGVRNKNT